jgi:hypothetical protein
MPHYHYTSRQAAQNIICTRRIVPGRGGRIYLTTTVYGEGHEAANALSIQDKAVELRCEVPEDRVRHPAPSEEVVPIINRDGSVIRKGGGVQVTTMQPINANQLRWFSLAEP